MKTISKNEVLQFDQKGYLIKKKFFKKFFVDKVLNEINSLKHTNKSIKVDKYYSNKVGTKKSMLVRIENFYKKSRYLTSLIEDKSINKFKKTF